MGGRTGGISNSISGARVAIFVIQLADEGNRSLSSDWTSNRGSDLFPRAADSLRLGDHSIRGRMQPCGLRAPGDSCIARAICGPGFGGHCNCRCDCDSRSIRASSVLLRRDAVYVLECNKDFCKHRIIRSPSEFFHWADFCSRFRRACSEVSATFGKAQLTLRENNREQQLWTSVDLGMDYNLAVSDSTSFPKCRSIISTAKGQRFFAYFEHSFKQW
jgi:hypothetical protein